MKLKKVKAIIRHGGQTASGIFAFNEQYEFVSFTTNDRAVSNTDGEFVYFDGVISTVSYDE